MKRLIPVVLTSAACALLAQAVLVSDFSVNRQELGKKKRAKVQFTLAAPANIDFGCEGLELAGWTSPQKLTVQKRDPVSNEIVAVHGEQLPPGTRLKVEVRRPAEAKKGESGECTLTARGAEGSTPEVKSFKISFK